MHDPHDVLFRFTFSHPRHAASVLRTILPPALADTIDWSSLRLVPDPADEAPEQRDPALRFTAQADGKPVLLKLSRADLGL